MTDMPVFGILCCGKDIKELSTAVKACGYITDILKNSGFVLGGYHTAIVKKGDDSLVKMCESKLSHLCKTCDVVFTVGCDGFDTDDIVPDITVGLCESEAVFFTSHLCGISNISNYDFAGTGKKKVPHSPSRSRAGIVGKCLVLNIRKEIGFIRSILPPLLPSVTFATSCISGKDAGENKKINEYLKKICKSPDKYSKTFFDRSFFGYK